MSSAYPVAGSSYAYTQRTFAAPQGFLTGWSLLLDYLFLPILSYLVIGISAVYVPGGLGAALTAQASVARILYAMGRDGVLPKGFFGRLSQRFQTPAYAIMLVGAVSLLALVIDLETMASIVSFGALVAFSAVNLSVIKHYFINLHERQGVALVRNLILPLLGFALTVWLWTNLSKLTLTVGLCWLAVGLAWLLILTRGFRRPTPTMGG